MVNCGLIDTSLNAVIPRVKNIKVVYTRVELGLGLKRWTHSGGKRPDVRLVIVPSGSVLVEKAQLWGLMPLLLCATHGNFLSVVRVS